MNRKRTLYFYMSLTIGLASITQTGQVDPHKVLFLFDIHDVFFKKKMSKVSSALWKHKQAFFNLPALSSLAHLAWIHFTDQEITSEEFIKAARDTKDPIAVELIKEIANAQEPIEGTVTIIKELHDAGYPLHIGSNIGIGSFKELTNKAKHPKLASILSYFDIPHSQISVSLPGRTIKKPQAEFFERYLIKNNNPDPSTIIFIDDIQQNIDTAKKLGFETIHFKNPQQLRSELVKRGFTFLKQH